MMVQAGLTSLSSKFRSGRRMHKAILGLGFKLPFSIHMQTFIRISLGPI